MKTNILNINRNASKIDLSNSNLKTFPTELLKCKNLKKLNLSNNKISNVPKEIALLSRLENIDLSNNKISVLYSKVFELKNLKVLIINNNSLKKLPLQIGQLKKLKKLSFSGNEITEFPKEISGLINLQELNIANNNLLEFPPEVFEIKSLTKLWINNNRFQYFPAMEIIENLINLTTIYCYSISKNRLDNLDRKYLLLTRKRGNSIHHLKVLAYKGRSFSMQVDKNKTLYPVSKINSNKIENMGLGVHNESTKPLPKQKNKIFISYSHKDGEWLEKINTFLDTMQYEGINIDSWDDTKLKSGDEWEAEITKALYEAYVAILIVSQDFLNSKFIRNNELPIILKSAELGGTKVLSIIVRPCTFELNKKLSQFQAVNTPSKPLSGMSPFNQEEVFVKLVYDVLDVIQDNEQ